MTMSGLETKMMARSVKEDLNEEQTQVLSSPLKTGRPGNSASKREESNRLLEHLRKTRMAMDRNMKRLGRADAGTLVIPKPTSMATAVEVKTKILKQLTRPRKSAAGSSSERSSSMLRRHRRS